MSIWWYMPYLWHCQITFSPRVTEWLLSAGDRAQHITLCWVTNQCIIQLRPIKLYNSNGGIVMWPMLVAGQPVLLTNTRGMISCPPDCSTDNGVSLLCYKKKKNLIVAQKNVRLWDCEAYPIPKTSILLLLSVLETCPFLCWCGWLAQQWTVKALESWNDTWEQRWEL